MSQDLNAKKFTAGQFSGELRNLKDSIPDWSREDPDLDEFSSYSGDEIDESSRYFGVEVDKSSKYFGVEAEESSSLRELPPPSAVKSLLTGKKIGPWQPLSDWIRITLLVIAITVNPLFFYIPVISDDRKCLELDRNLFLTAFILCSVCDLYHVLYTLSSLLLNLFDTGGLKHKWDSSLRVFYSSNGGDFLLCIVIDYLVTLPLQMLVVPDLILKLRGPEFLNAMKLLKLVLFIIHVARIIRIYSLFIKVTRNSGELSEATWARAAFNLLLYLQAANVFGALWYLMAIERKTECWKKAFINHTGHSSCPFNCDDTTLGNHTFLNGSCPAKTQNMTGHDFGIFHDALKSGIVEVTNFPQKFLHCFLWGLKNLSSIGQNLQTSSDVQENFFVISIVISSLVLFGLLIGDMQKSLLSRNIRLKKVTTKAREIEEWEPFQKLSKDLQQEVKKHRQYIRRKTNDIDVENILNNVPMELRRKIKRELCLKLLKKVRDFEILQQETLDALCDCVKPAFFVENSLIVREGDPIDEMIFVVQGKLWTYTFKDKTSGSTSKEAHVIDGELCGKELLHWALKHKQLPNIPTSKRTIQALTNVEAFTLMADDIINVFVKPGLSTFHTSDWNPSRNRAARVIQLAWRRHRTKKPSHHQQLTKDGPAALPLAPKRPRFPKETNIKRIGIESAGLTAKAEFSRRRLSRFKNFTADEL